MCLSKTSVILIIGRKSADFLNFLALVNCSVRYIFLYLSDSENIKKNENLKNV